MAVTANYSASIFTKNHKEVPVADKGWKEGEAYVFNPASRTAPLIMQSTVCRPCLNF